jgi:hypothetical protein
MSARKSDDFISDVERQFEWYVVNANWEIAERYHVAAPGDGRTPAGPGKKRACRRGGRSYSLISHENASGKRKSQRTHAD